MKTLFPLLFMVALASSSFAQTNTLDQFQGNFHFYNSSKMPHLLYIPKLGIDDGKVGLVLALHGFGMVITEDYALHDGMAYYWSHPRVQAEYPCFVLVPQCPDGSRWEYNSVSENVIDLIDSLINIYPIDSKRIYVTGSSWGGTGTWSMMNKYPGKFAAAAPVCGSYSNSEKVIERIKNIPVWNFHGQDDHVIETYNSQLMVYTFDRLGYNFVFPVCFYGNCNYYTDDQYQAIVDGPYDFIYSEYPGVGHEAASYAYTHSFLYKWMLSKVQRSKDVITLSGFDSYSQISGTTKISWVAQNPSDSVEVWLSPDLENSWISIGKSIASAGSIAFNSELVKDCAFGTIKLLTRNSKGFSNGSARSVPQAINNEGNSAPFLKILLRLTGFLADSISVNMKVGDAENDPLTIRFLYSSDGGNVFAAIDTVSMKTNIDYQTYWLMLKNLRYSTKAKVKIEVTDGNLSTSYLSETFVNNSGYTGVHPNLKENMVSSLNQNYPNPFNSSTTIYWQLARSSRATLKVFDLVGREVAIPVDGQRPAGKYETEFNAATLPKGVYFYQLKAGEFVQTRKMILLK